jgi:D-amino-acid dehydrogenase
MQWAAKGNRIMARVDVVVLGAGVVGVSIALQLAKRSMSVALIDRGPPGEETSYGNAGIIEGNTVFAPAFPNDPMALLRVIFKQAPEANYQFSALPTVLPWLARFRSWSSTARRVEHARTVRPLFATAIPEHEALLAEAGGSKYLRKAGWLKIYRKDSSFETLAAERVLAKEFGIVYDIVSNEQIRALEPSLSPVAKHAVFWPNAVSINNPLGVTRAYLSRFEALGGVFLTGDARSLHRNGAFWRVETNEGSLDAEQVVVALGPWAPDLLEPLGIKLPMAVKRGYHRHFKGRGNASVGRPILDADYGYNITPMEQGIRITTGAEFAPRDAAPTPVQFDRLMPGVESLFPIGERVDDKTWKGARPCFPDSRPIIDRAPGQKGMWLAIGHAHWGLTLGPSTGKMLGDMMSGGTPFVDPAPYRADRFS